jgi:hypothetical protein
MKKLDWTLLLGFEQVVRERDCKPLANSRIGSKVGGKGIDLVRESAQAR